MKGIIFKFYFITEILFFLTNKIILQFNDLPYTELILHKLRIFEESSRIQINHLVFVANQIHSNEISILTIATGLFDNTEFQLAQIDRKATEMVILHVKRGDENQFLYETTVNSSVDDVVRGVTAIFNGRLKVTRICYEMEELQKHGTFLPPEMQGLNGDQIKELKLEDPWAKRCAPVGYIEAKDEMCRRCGLAPPPNLQEVLKKAAETAKEIISKKHVDLRKCLTQKDVSRALDELRGATKIVFPAGLPPHDPVRMELDNVEDLSGTQAANEVIDPSRACLWTCGKKLLSGNLLSDHLGNNDKSKVTVKLCSVSEGAPGREPVLTEEERKQLMLQAYRKQEEWKKLEQDDDDNYLNSKWADGQNLKRQFHGLNNIDWKPMIKK